MQLLLAAKLIAGDPPKPEAVEWTGGKAVLVQLGDLIDKYNQSVRVLTLLRALQPRAAKAGGRVIVLMGNHEAEFLSSPVGKKTRDFVEDLQRAKIDPAAVAEVRDPTGLGRFLTDLPVAARVEDWFFAHAGNTDGLTFAKLAASLHDDIAANGFRTPILLGDNGLLEARLSPSPWWERAGDTPKQSRDRLTQWATALGAKHLVFGHQADEVTFNGGDERKAGQLHEQFDGVLFLADVGYSRGIGYSTGALLHIRSGTPRTWHVIKPGK